MTTSDPTAPEASLDWCHSCLKLEPLPARYYIVCGECGHVYVSPGDLEEVYVGAGPDDVVRVDAGVITFCPLCLHDF